MAYTSDQLTMLMVDLGLLTAPPQVVAYLETLLDTAQQRLTRQGIALIPDDPEHDTLVVMFAAWLYRKRTGDGNSDMPLPLRKARNDLLFSQKGAAE